MAECRTGKCQKFSILQPNFFIYRNKLFFNVMNNKGNAWNTVAWGPFLWSIKNCFFSSYSSNFSVQKEINKHKKNEKWRFKKKKSRFHVWKKWTLDFRLFLYKKTWFLSNLSDIHILQHSAKNLKSIMSDIYDPCKSLWRVRGTTCWGSLPFRGMDRMAWSVHWYL